MPKREVETDRRVGLLIHNFEHYLFAFDQAPAFKRTGQLKTHLATIAKRRELGTATAAIRDISFLHSLYETLRAWGIGQRGSKLLEFDDFVQAVRGLDASVARFEECRLNDPSPEQNLAIGLWELVEDLKIVDNEAKLVPCTKALHHILPDLFVPIDRQFTRVFFGWYVPEFQYQQKRVFYTAYENFARIAREANPQRFTGSGWKTSLTKNIDNALVGFCQIERLPSPS